MTRLHHHRAQRRNPLPAAHPRRWPGLRALAGALVMVAPLLLVPPSLAAGKPSPRASWPAAGYPSAGPPRVIGGYGAACISGAVALPSEGPGYQAADLSRRRFYGHPTLVDFIVQLGQRAVQLQLGTVLVGDMAQPRGGPMSSGHVSHQGGLDVDLWFRLDLPPLPPQRRDGLPQPSVVDPRTGRPDPTRWTIRHAELVRAAAEDERVSRVFVGAAIKRDLCERTWTDRRWLQRVRPWPGHDDHLHVRLHCPPSSPQCRQQPPLPPGEACGQAELQLAAARERAFGSRPPPVPSGNLPAACRQLLTASQAAPP